MRKGARKRREGKFRAILGREKREGEGKEGKKNLGRYWGEKRGKGKVGKGNLRRRWGEKRGKTRTEKEGRKIRFRKFGKISVRGKYDSYKKKSS